MAHLIDYQWLILLGCPPGIRTPIGRVRVVSPTIERGGTGEELHLPESRTDTSADCLFECNGRGGQGQRRPFGQTPPHPLCRNRDTRYSSEPAQPEPSPQNNRTPLFAFHSRVSRIRWLPVPAHRLPPPATGATRSPHRLASAFCVASPDTSPCPPWPAGPPAARCSLGRT
jgi:hypothetical protein